MQQIFPVRKQLPLITEIHIFFSQMILHDIKHVSVLYSVSDIFTLKNLFKY